MVNDTLVQADLMSPAPRRPARPQGRTFFGRPDDAIIKSISEANVLGIRATAGSSLSMFLNLEGEDNAAFKPATNRGQRWYGELAAYRIGRLLGIERIPPAVTRDIRIPVMRGLLASNQTALDRFNEEAIYNGDNTVGGALMYWVPEIHEAEVDRLENLDEWGAAMESDEDEY